jgi:hypothetical protein
MERLQGMIGPFHGHHHLPNHHSRPPAAIQRPASLLPRFLVAVRSRPSTSVQHRSAFVYKGRRSESQTRRPLARTLRATHSAAHPA